MHEELEPNPAPAVRLSAGDSERVRASVYACASLQYAPIDEDVRRLTWRVRETRLDCCFVERVDAVMCQPIANTSPTNKLSL